MNAPNKTPKTLNLLSTLFLLISIITISVRLTGNDELENIFKPMLMPVLMIILYTHSNKLSSIYSRLIFMALGFSLLGDIFLMPLFDNFIFGLASFLLAHVLYIIAFAKMNSSFVLGLIKGKLYSSIIFLAYVFLVAFLVNKMIDSNTETFLLVAVVIYASVITLMVLFSISLSNNVEGIATKMIMVGAILFMLSDSIIAINKFAFEVDLSGLWIMSTYTLGQWMIAVGSVKAERML
ncbi:MAG: lysoplasmalogenase [Bacteroidota bacterium]